MSSVAIGIAADGEMRAYVGCDNGYVYCLSIEDSPQDRKLWEYNIEVCVESSPTVYAGNVYVGASRYIGTNFVALNAKTGELLWKRELGHEVRATAATLLGHVFIGEDTGWSFFRLNGNTGDKSPDQNPPNPFDARYYRPVTTGESDYFVGSAAFTSAGFGLVGNDNFALYTLSSSDILHITTRGTDGIVCSSPAISYTAQPSHRWVYVISRANGGKLIAYRQQLN